MCQLVGSLVVAFIFTHLRSSVFSLPSRNYCQWPDDCEGLDYCVKKARDYPDESISVLMQNFHNVTDLGYITSAPPDDRRTGTSTSQECPANIQTGPVYEIIDSKGRVRFVVQSDKLHQPVRIETCVNPGPIMEETAHFDPYLFQDVNLSCVNNYIDYEFIVLSFDMKSLEYEFVRIPVCCTCRIAY